MLNEIDQSYKIIDYNESFIDDQRTFVPLQSTETETETKWEVEQKQKNRQRENEKDVIQGESLKKKKENIKESGGKNREREKKEI